MRNPLRFFSFGKHTVTHASALLAVTAIVSNVLGLARNLVFNRLNSPADLDVYFNSFRIADFLLNTLIIGAVTAAVIPALSGLIGAGKEERAERTANELISWSALIFGVLGIILFLAMPAIQHLLFPAYDHDPARRNQLILLSRLLLVQPLLFAASYVVGSLLNGHHRFGSYSVAPLLYNISLIVGGGLSARFGIQAIIWSVLAGAFLHLAVQSRELLAMGHRFRLRLTASSELREIAAKMIQPCLAQGFGQAVLTLYAFLANQNLTAGSYSIYTMINNLQTTPTVVIASSLASASFPGIVSAIATGKWERLNELLAKLIRTALFLLIPTVVIGLVLRAQVVRLYVGIGHHVSWELTNAGVETFAFFLLGVIPASLAIILGRLFYAHKDTRTPMLIAVAGGAVAIATSLVGIRLLHSDVSALAAAEALSSLTQCLLSFVILYRRRHLRLPVRQLFDHLGTYLAGAAVLAAACWGTLRIVDTLYLASGHASTSSIVGLLIQTALAAGVGGLSYLLYSTRMSKEELQWTVRRAFVRNR